MTASFVLTFCGIDFSLDPKQSGATISFDHAKSSEEAMLLTLNNFTGTLRVSSSPPTTTTTGSIVTPASSGRVSLSPENRPAKTKTTRRPKQQASTTQTKPTASTDRSSTNDISTDEESSHQKRRVVCSDDDSSPHSKKGKLELETFLKVPTTSNVSHEKSRILTNPEESAMHKISPDARKAPSAEVETSASASSTTTTTTAVMVPVAKPPVLLPPARWGHTMTVTDDDTKILVYGGQTLNDDTSLLPTTTHGDVYVYDRVAHEFAKPVHCEGVERQWHSAVYLAERQLLIAFGGEAPTGTRGKMETLNQVMVLDTEIMLWYPPTVTGEIPAGRSGHSASLLSDQQTMVVFGGVGKGSKYQRALSVLDTVRWKWTAPPKILGDAPRPRSYHTATSIVQRVKNRPENESASGNPVNGVIRKDWIVVFGGNDHDKCFNSVHVLEVRGDCWSWINPIVSGDIPAPRTGHVATLMEDGKSIFVHGGWDPNAEDEDQEVIFEDCFLLDTSTWVWTKLDQTVPARVGHRAVQSKGGVEMFGGRLEGGKFSNELLMLNVD